MKPRKYKMRAEAPIDFVAAFDTVAMRTWTVRGGSEIGLGDCVIEFTSPWLLLDIIAALKSVPDGHVMAETVALAADYTGNR